MSTTGRRPHAKRSEEPAVLEGDVAPAVNAAIALALALSLPLVAGGCGAIGGPRSGELVFELGDEVDGGPDAGDGRDAGTADAGAADATDGGVPLTSE